MTGTGRVTVVVAHDVHSPVFVQNSIAHVSDQLVQAWTVCWVETNANSTAD